MISQSCQLLQQSTAGVITVKSTEAGVICINSCNITGEIVMTVNCLRSGCPAIELLLDDCVEEYLSKIIARAIKLLSSLEIEKEKFYVQKIVNNIVLVTRGTQD